MTAVESRPRRWLRWTLRQLEHCLALIGLGTLVYCACFDASRVTSGSMKPTLRGENWATGDRVLTERVSYWFRSPRRWEVVTFRKDDGVEVMKRVIGLPGEQVQILRGGQVLVNGQPVERPAALDIPKYLPVSKVHNGKKVQCGKGYFVLGDDTFDSDDSRFNDPVPPDDLVGRAWLIFGPSGRRGFVNL
jgi:signal peptidase I